jgi:hypothetical protein
MLTLGRPPTHERYLSEVAVLAGLRVRPVRLWGPPRATPEEVAHHLAARGARLVGPYHVLVGHKTLITLHDDALTLWAVTPAPPAAAATRPPPLTAASTPAADP